MLLIQKPLKQGDVVSLKISSGEEIMARFESEDEQGILVYKPAMLAMTQEGPALAPYMMTADQTAPFRFFKSTLVSLITTDKEMAKSYLQSTTDITT